MSSPSAYRRCANDVRIFPLLVAHFLRKYAAQNNKQVSGIQQQVLQYLQHADWPGNVRELENVIERAVVLAKDPIIGLAELPAHIPGKGARANVRRPFRPAPPGDPC